MSFILLYRFSLHVLFVLVVLSLVVVVGLLLLLLSSSSFSKKDMTDFDIGNVIVKRYKGHNS